MLRVVHHNSIQRHHREHSTVGQITHRRFRGLAFGTVGASLQGKKPRVASHSNGWLVQAREAHSRPEGEGEDIRIRATRKAANIFTRTEGTHTEPIDCQVRRYNELSVPYRDPLNRQNNRMKSCTRPTVVPSCFANLHLNPSRTKTQGNVHSYLHQAIPS